ncbi:MAG: flavin reductase family protein [bacterium]|nr:flavin reductase family protein [bacterium]
MIHIETKDLGFIDNYRYMSGGIAPRPIALVSTLSEDGINNLAPFSYYNAFSSDPPVIGFSTAIRGRDNTTKDTHNNLSATGECVVNAVTYDMVEQISLASCEYGPEVDEFTKSGLTPLDSDLIAPKRVGESPFQMECRLLQMIELGKNPGAGYIALCEILKYHIDEDIIEDGIIKPELIDLCGRNSGNFYTRTSGDAVFEVLKPGNVKGIGFDALPVFIRNSHVYSANDLGRFAIAEAIPDTAEVNKFINSFSYTESTEESFERSNRTRDHENMLRSALFLANNNHPKKKLLFELTAKCALDNNETDFAWKTALYVDMI